MSEETTKQGAAEANNGEAAAAETTVTDNTGSEIMSAEDLAAAAAAAGADPAALTAEGVVSALVEDEAMAPAPRELTFGMKLVGVSPVDDPDENQDAAHIKDVFAHAADVIHNSADKGVGPTNYKQAALDKIVEACAQCVKHLTSPN